MKKIENYIKKNYKWIVLLLMSIVFIMFAIRIKNNPGLKIDDDVYNVYFILHGRETIKVKGMGTVNTIKFAAKLLEGEVFKGEEDMIIWVTDDENRLPVFFEAPLLVGVATGRMTAYSGLKYPFTSLVETKRK